MSILGIHIIFALIYWPQIHHVLYFENFYDSEGIGCFFPWTIRLQVKVLIWFILHTSITEKFSRTFQLTECKEDLTWWAASPWGRGQQGCLLHRLGYQIQLYSACLPMDILCCKFISGLWNYCICTLLVTALTSFVHASLVGHWALEWTIYWKYLWLNARAGTLQCPCAQNWGDISLLQNIIF